jgi:hypothetical protein
MTVAFEVIFPYYVGFASDAARLLLKIGYRSGPLERAFVHRATDDDLLRLTLQLGGQRLRHAGIGDPLPHQGFEYSAGSFPPHFVHVELISTPPWRMVPEYCSFRFGGLLTHLSDMEIYLAEDEVLAVRWHAEGILEQLKALAGSRG